MEPRIQYAKTSDGVSIAFWTLGEGPPLVMAPMAAFSHIQLEWQVGALRQWWERLATRRKLIRIDPRGLGLSDRAITDFSLECLLRDIEAVVARLGLETFALMGGGPAGPVLVAYAAGNPRQVTHLILWNTGARMSNAIHPALRMLREQDWEVYTETMAHFTWGWTRGEEAHEIARVVRESISQETMLRWWEHVERGEYDVDDLLPAVKTPTLVMQRQDLHAPGVEPARELATGIPAARLVVFPGSSPVPYGEGADAVLAEIESFLGEGEEPPGPDLPQGTAVILFADIADSTALTERLGDAAFRSKARELDTALRGVISEASGTPVEGKLLGDGVLAVFTSARQAIEAALRCGQSGDDADLPLHLGLHAGDVIREGNNVYGGAVNIAARIAAASAPSEVLVSDTVRSLARTSAGVSFEDRGEHELKGVGEPQRLFAVREGGA